MVRPITDKQCTVRYLVMVGSYQLLYTRTPPRTALAGAVEDATVTKRPQLRGLVGGVLRQFQCQQDKLLIEFSASDVRYLHPPRLLRRLQRVYPEQWQSIVEANSQHPSV